MNATNMGLEIKMKNLLMIFKCVLDVCCTEGKGYFNGICTVNYHP